jgi:DNA (cytosine-5)-methyltransferase 1
LDLRNRHLDEFTGRYIIDVLECDKAEELTAHKARSHSDRDLRDFFRLIEGENSGQAIKRGEIMEFPYNRESFRDRYTRQSGSRLCSTILAHLSKDGLMFIHPTQNRSITPREAARIQSFPDTFLLPTSRTNQFKFIGNAVPPLVGLALGKGISNWLDLDAQSSYQNHTIENVQKQRLALMNMIKYGETYKVCQIPKDIFNSGWLSIHYFLPNLHPISALENGDSVVMNYLYDYMNLRCIDHVLMDSVYERSGWPVKLVPYAKEAYRRHDNGSLNSSDYYWSS